MAGRRGSARSPRTPRQRTHPRQRRGAEETQGSPPDGTQNVAKDWGWMGKDLRTVLEKALGIAGSGAVWCSSWCGWESPASHAHFGVLHSGKA